VNPLARCLHATNSFGGLPMRVMHMPEPKRLLGTSMNCTCEVGAFVGVSEMGLRRTMFRYLITSPHRAHPRAMSKNIYRIAPKTLQRPDSQLPPGYVSPGGVQKPLIIRRPRQRTKFNRSPTPIAGITPETTGLAGRIPST